MILGMTGPDDLKLGSYRDNGKENGNYYSGFRVQEFRVEGLRTSPKVWTARVLNPETHQSPVKPSLQPRALEPWDSGFRVQV